ncbi:hypothetical protein ABK040_005265 [Willaertia magna]
MNNVQSLTKTPNCSSPPLKKTTGVLLNISHQSEVFSNNNNSPNDISTKLQKGEQKYSPINNNNSYHDKVASVSTSIPLILTNGNVLENHSKQIVESQERIQVLEEVVAHLNNQLKIIKNSFAVQFSEITDLIENQFNVMNTNLNDKITTFETRLNSIEENVNTLTHDLTKEKINRKRDKLSTIASVLKDNIRIETLDSSSVLKSPNVIVTETTLSDEEDDNIKEKEEGGKAAPNSSAKKRVSIKEDEIFVNPSPIKSNPAFSLEENNYLPIYASPFDINNTWMSNKSINSPNLNQYIPSLHVDMKENLVDQEMLSSDCSFVVEKYSKLLNSLFSHFTQMNSVSKGEFKKTMSKSQFMKFCTESKIATISELTRNYDVLWAHILKKLELIKNYNTKEGAIVQLTYNHFERILIEIGNELKENSMSSAQKFETLILTYLIPLSNTLPKEELSKSTELINITHNISTNASLHLNDSLVDISKIENSLKKHRKELKKIWESFSSKKTQSISKPIVAIVGMNMAELIDFCQTYSIKSLITKKDLITIFEKRTDLKKKGSENRLSFKAFEWTLLDIANRVYGDKPFSQIYQTIEARFDKLLTKINLK